MEDPRPRLQDALRAAMVSKDTVRRDTIRIVLSELKQVEIDEQKTLSVEEAMAVLQKEAKKRRESIEEAERMGRQEIAAQEQVELSIIEGFLPEQLSHDEIVAIVQEAIAETGATSVKEMGKVMAVVMPKVKGVADGKLVNQIARELLGE